MLPRNITEKEFLNDLRLINLKLNVIKAEIAKIDQNLLITIDGKQQHLKSILEQLFPPHINIDGTNLINYWDETNKLELWETTLGKITEALLANDITSQMTLRGKRKRDSDVAENAAKPKLTTLDQIDDIASHAETLRNQVKVLCTGYYGAVKETKDKRKTVLMAAPLEELEHLQNESDLKSAARRMKSGDPALDAVNELLSTPNSRATALSLFNSNFFKHQIYEQSIENMARAILKEDRDLFARLDPNELAEVKLSDFSRRKKKDPVTGADIELTGSCIDYSNHFNQLSWRVVKDILQLKNANKDAAQIAFSIDYWINVAYELAYNPNLPDLNGAMAIIFGLHSGSLTAILKLVMDSKKPLINDKTRGKYEELAALCDLSHDAKAPEAFAEKNPNSIVPIALLQKKIEYADGNKQPREPLLTQFQKHITGATGASIPDTNYRPNIGEVGDEKELNAAADAITVKKHDNKRKFAKNTSAIQIRGQLKKVKIKRDTTLTQETPATKNARIEAALPADYSQYHIRIGKEADPLHTQIYAGLKALGLKVVTHDSPAENMLDLFESAKNLCEGKVNDISNRLTQAPALIRAIAIAHYIVNSSPPDQHAMHFFHMALQQLSPQEKEGFFAFVEKLPPYKQKFEDSDLAVSQFHDVANPPIQTAFPDYTKEREKQGGANDAGKYGGVYTHNDSHEAVLFKSEPDKEKVQGESFVGQLTFNTLQTLQTLESKDDNYSNKFVAKVSLENAIDIDDVQRKQFSEKNPIPADHLLYLKSEFIPNIGDFWTVALALVDPRFIPMQNLPANERIEQLKNLANTIKAERGNQRPTALFKSYDHPDIAIPSNFILNNNLLKQFCEMVAIRILFADFGVHNGNFVIIAKPSADNKDIVFELGCIDFGAGFDKLTNEVKPFERKEFMEGFKFTFYKNHLLDYVPEITRSTEMAQAFILAGKLEDKQLEENINLVMAEDRAKSSVETLVKLCIRMKIPEDIYKGVNNKAELLSKMRKFVYDTSIIRKNNLSDIGYGLLIENCFADANGRFDAKGQLNIALLNQHLAAYPELKDYVEKKLSKYEPNRGVAKSCFEQVKAFCKNDPLVIKKRKTLEDKFQSLHNNLQIDINELKALKAGLANGTKKPEDFIDKNYDGIYAGYLLSYRDCMDSHAEFNNISNFQIPHINVPAQRDLEELNQLIQELNVSTGKIPNPLERATIPVEPKAENDKTYVLTIGMLGTSEHRAQGATLIKQFCDSVEQSKYQSSYLLDGVAAKPTDKSEHPMLGTYDVTDCTRDDKGAITVKKEPKSFGACSQAMGLLRGKGTHDAIAEAMLVIETMLNAREDDTIPLTINLAGFSRGADNTLRLANAIAEKYTRKEVVVNIFALDPVAGPMRNDATKARLIPDIVQNYEAVLMRNEPRTAFKVRDKRHITVQDPNVTNVNYHLYRGNHSQGNYFYADPLAVNADAFDADLPNDVRQSEAARLVANDLSQFAGKHGTKLKEPSLRHIQYAETKDRKTVQTALLTDQQKLAAYTRMMQADFDPEQNERSKKAKDAPARDFTNNLSDYFLHGSNFFIDQTHMQLVFDRLKDKYKYVLDHLFQKDVEYGSDELAQGKILRELEEMLRQDPDLYYCLKDFPQAPEPDPDWTLPTSVRNPQYPSGIPVRVSTFYQPGNPLNKQWQLLIAALSPVFIGRDHSFSIDEANQYYQRAYAVLCDAKGDKNLDKREANKAAALQQIVAEINDKKIQQALSKSKNADEGKNMINAVCAKLERALGKKKSYPSVYRDIVQALREAAKDIAAKNLAHDPQLVKQLLNEALRAINATESEYRGGSNDFKKAIRKCIIMIAPVNEPELNVEQVTNAANIHSVFASNLKMNVDHVEVIDNPAFKAEEAHVAAEDEVDEVAGAAPLAPKPEVDNAIDPAIENLRACTIRIIQMLRDASSKMQAEARLPDDYKPSFAPRRDAHPIKIDDSPIHRFFYRNPHDKTTPVVNPFEPPKFDLR